MRKRSIIISFIVIGLLCSGCNNGSNLNELNSKLAKVSRENEQLKEEVSQVQAERDELKRQLASKTEENLEQEADNLPMNPSLPNARLRIVYTQANQLGLILTEQEEASRNVCIIGSQVEGVVEQYDHINIKGSGTGQFLNLDVIGTIYDVQLLSITFDENGETVDEVKEVIPTVKNTTVTIETILPCGAPSEKLIWKDEKGNPYELYLTYDGYGFFGEIILLK